jgi:hypothetical protein
VPPAGKSDKGPGDAAKTTRKSGAAATHDGKDRNLAEQGRQGNVKQNTTHKGFQQDR